MNMLATVSTTRYYLILPNLNCLARDDAIHCNKNFESAEKNRKQKYDHLACEERKNVKLSHLGICSFGNRVLGFYSKCRKCLFFI